MNQTQVVLSSNNFRVVKVVKAYVEYKRSLRFDQAQLSRNAYAELLRVANLKGSQALINVTLENVKRDSRNIFLFSTIQNAIMAQGVVIEFISPNETTTDSSPSQPTASQSAEPQITANNNSEMIVAPVQQPTVTSEPKVEPKSSVRELTEREKFINDSSNWPNGLYATYASKLDGSDKDGIISEAEFDAFKKVLISRKKSDKDFLNEFKDGNFANWASFRMSYYFRAK